MTSSRARGTNPRAKGTNPRARTTGTATPKPAPRTPKRRQKPITAAFRDGMARAEISRRYGHTEAKTDTDHRLDARTNDWLERADRKPASPPADQQPPTTAELLAAADELEAQRRRELNARPRPTPAEQAERRALKTARDTRNREKYAPNQAAKHSR